jgi:hypothetical protein
MRSKEAVTPEEMVHEVHRQFDIALDADGRAWRSRVKAGQMLNELRSQIGEAEWWDWYKSKFVRSKKDAEKVMALAADEQRRKEGGF